MQFSKKTVLELFDSSQKTFVIPVYQRAYSWEESNWNTFLSDLCEQAEGENNYFYGNLLLETIARGRQYEVIDGQQRLTTLTIFMRSLLNIFTERKNLQEQLDETTKQQLAEMDIAQRETIYFKNGGTIKLHPVEYDEVYFNTLIIDNNPNIQPDSISQKRMKAAKEFFDKKLSEIDTGILLKIFAKLEATDITCIELDGKKDSALMFELQNNRGAALTNMEKLKSFFMYQMYVYSDKDEIESNVKYLAQLYEKIYIILNDIKDENQSLQEDSILLYHCQAYLNGFNYRSIDEVKTALKKSGDKVAWIKAFVLELDTTFKNFKQLSKNHRNDALDDIRRIGSPAWIYPFLIRGYKYLEENSDNFNDLLRALEILVFRDKLVNSRAGLEGRINWILLNFIGDVQALIKSLKQKLNEEYHWSDLRMKAELDGVMYGDSVLHYFLWKYEESIQGKGYKIGYLNGQTIKILDEEIEHISPVTPPNGESIKTGYEVGLDGKYTQEFTEKYLNRLGNLLLISKSHNSSIGNQSFDDKLDSYTNRNILLQQKEIRDFANPLGGIRWDSAAIDRRQSRLLEFGLKKWNFDQLIKIP
ncbi:MAG: DUF262 domain-containing HNH endonuclease family protein [Anaerolineales bacterium]|jgi:hypothetical protein|nr:DUF262 domain-containing HNH endonuclease family protein [Anaerolineales bacterium]